MEAIHLDIRETSPGLQGKLRFTFYVYTFLVWTKSNQLQCHMYTSRLYAKSES